MTADKIQLNTLKQCLMFLEWLKTDEVMQNKVASELHRRISKYFKKDDKHFNLPNVKKGLSDFLTTVSAFYTRLCKDPAPGSYTGKNPNDIVDAFLECLPKFLAAIYFLEYCVNQAFKDLGGGGWQQDWPAWNAGHWRGGDLANYLYAKSGDRKYNSRTGLIPGGLTYGDVRYSNWRDYYQGYNMVGDLGNIMSKGNYNFLRSVFVTSVFSTDRGTAMQNTANAVSLVRTFCDIVKDEHSPDGGDLKKALEAGLKNQVTPRSICWQDLQSHCAQLRDKLTTLFNNEKRFDFTEQSTQLKNLNKEELARETANWMREKLNQVRGKLNGINMNDPAVNDPNKGNLGAYSTNNIFPYGFTLKGRFNMSPKEVKALMQDWREVIDDLKKGNDGLEKLKEILDGTYVGACKMPEPSQKPVPEEKSPATPPKKPEVPPDPTKTGSARPVATKTEATKPVVTKAEAAKPTATKGGEGAQNQGKKAEGAQNQGKKSEGAQNQGKKGEGFPTPQVTDSAAPSPTPGAPGDAGPKGDQGPQGSPVTVTPVPTVTVSPTSQDTISPVQNTVQHQQPVPSPSIPPPPPAPPSTSGAPGSPSQPGQGLPGDGSPGPLPGSPQDSVLTQSPSASSSSPGSTGGRGLGNRVIKMVVKMLVSQQVKAPVKPKQRHYYVGCHGVWWRWGKKQCKSDEYLVKDSGGNEMCFRNPQNPAPTKSYGPNLSPDFLKKLREKEADVLKKAEEEEERRRQQYLQYYYPKTFHQIPTAVESSATMGLDGVDVSNESLYDPGLWWEQRYRNDWNYPKQLVEWTAKKEQEKFERNLEEAKQNVSKQLKDTWILQELRDDDLGHVVVPYIHTSMPLPDPEYPDPLAPKALSLSGSVIDSPPPETDDPVPPPTGDQYDWDIEVVQPHPDAVESALIGIDPYSDVKDDGLVFEKIDRQSDAKQDYVDLHIDVRKPIVQDLVDNPDEYLYSNAEDILRDELKNAESWHGEDKGFSALPKSNFNIEFTPSFLESDGKHDAGITRGTPRKPYDQHIPVFPDSGVCQNPWYVPDASSTTVTPPLSPPPDTDHLPPPDTVREMLCWLVGMAELGYIPFIEDHLKSILTEYNKDVCQPPDALEVTRDPYTLDAARVANTLTEASLYGASVLHRIKHKDNSKAVSVPDFSSEYSKLCYSTDPARLLCQLRDYVYACCHQLEFLRSQCSRKQSYGGWQDCEYGRDIKIPSPLQAFLTDASTSKFETHRFDPCDICLKSRINMGFQKDDFSKDSNDGKHLHTILSPSCGGEDPLLTLSSYLNCLTRRTPRTTGELVSFFHNFGNELHQSSPLGSALSKSHGHCPNWDCLAEEDLQVIEDLRGSAPPISIHDQCHPKTLSTLLGCGIDNVNCPQLMKPITYRAYALYSSSFVHHYLSWVVHLTDRLWESLHRLHQDLEDLQCSKSKALHRCADALPLLYSHGFTPPEGTLQSSLKCSQLIAKLWEVVAGQPIADLMTAMDTFLYGIREPFVYTVFSLWLTATLYILGVLLYRIDALRIRSHLRSPLIATQSLPAAAHVNSLGNFMYL
ncbi:ribosome binding protein [Babesia ovata]|uniref:Ribosome binding protein n=1 Tax=Babesia ovata TaxID=189622 RepID=A0A2H6KHN8_9APIC|nr:ribosome binding protein [Babesia ovata]GBE62505.1 ribosome binding protein [Babesia ovata]